MTKRPPLSSKRFARTSSSRGTTTRKRTFRKRPSCASTAELSVCSPVLLTIPRPASSDGSARLDVAQASGDRLQSCARLAQRTQAPLRSAGLARRRLNDKSRDPRPEVVSKRTNGHPPCLPNGRGCRPSPARDRPGDRLRRALGQARVRRDRSQTFGPGDDRATAGRALRRGRYLHELQPESTPRRVPVLPAEDPAAPGLLSREPLSASHPLGARP